MERHTFSYRAAKGWTPFSFSSGEIVGGQIIDHSRVAGPIQFQRTKVTPAAAPIASPEYSEETLQPGTEQIGFYSYGEISPYAKGACDLHNQTMTITTFSEA
jgi:hypothetical protein